MDNSQRWWAVAALGLATFLASVDLNIVTLALPQMARFFKQSDASMALVILTYTITMALCLLPAGFWMTRVPPLLTVVLAVLGFGLASVLCGLAPTFGVLLIGRVLQGIFAAFLTTLGTAVVAIIVLPGERGKALGALSAVATLGSVAGSGLGGFVINDWGWPAIFFVNVPVCVLAMLLALWSLRWAAFQEEKAEPYGKSLLKLLGQSHLIAVLLCLGGLSLVAGAIYFLLPFDLTQIQHFLPSTEGLLLLCIPVGMVAFALVGGYLTDRSGTRPVMLLGVLVVIAGIVAQLFVLGQSASPSAVSWRLLLTGAGIGLFGGPVQTLVVTLSPRQSLGVASALSALVRYVGFALGPFLVSTTWAFVPAGAAQMVDGMLAIGVCTALCFGLTWLATRRPPTPSPENAAQRHFRVSPAQSVRTRLTLWYLAVMAIIIVLFDGGLYASQAFLSPDAAENKLETQLYQDSQRFAETYKQALLDRRSPKTLHLNQSSQEMVLLLRPDGSVLDARGPLTGSIIQQLQARIEQNSEMTDLTIPQNRSHGWWGWWATNNDYRVLITPVLNQNARVARLLVGLPHPHTFPLLAIWIIHGMLALLLAAIGGYWLAGKVLRPVKMITRTANEINATDLRRRLHLQSRDEFGELAATFDQMLARLEAAFKRQAQFTADASHELRTPLSIIDLEINRALEQLEQPEDYRHVLEQIQAENEQMTAMVNSLLLLARADTGQMILNLQEVDLSDIALASVERLLTLASQSQVTLATGDLPELLIRGDPQYLGQMLTNLIENGIKYTSGIGKRVFVELACERQRCGIVRVQDDGPGIAEEHLPSLFERFYRVDKARARRQKRSALTGEPGHEEPGGSGLGLSIVQWIVLAHGGEIRVESKIGAGSLFEVRLPLLSKVEE